MQLEGKIIDFLGDSITEGVGVSDRENNRYDNILKKRLKLKAVHNYGIGGTRLAHQAHPSDKPRYDLCFCGRAYDLCPDADLIMVYGGVNDYIHGDAPVGEIGDRTPATFCGAVDFLMKLLRETYPSAKVVFLTPARCLFGASDYRYPSRAKGKQADAKPLRFYCEVMIETAKKYGIDVLDLYEAMPVEILDGDARKRYTTDGLHFNDDGHHILADVIEEFLMSV